MGTRPRLHRYGLDYFQFLKDLMIITTIAEFGSKMSAVHPWVAKSQLKLYLIPNMCMYLSKCFSRPGHIEVEGEQVGVVEKILITGRIVASNS
jgi:hypothetical protein